MCADVQTMFSTSVSFICIIFLDSTRKNSKGKGESRTEKWFLIAFPMYSLKAKLFLKVRCLNHNFVGNKSWSPWPWDPSSLSLSCLSNLTLAPLPGYMPRSQRASSPSSDTEAPPTHSSAVAVLCAFILALG